MADIFRYAIIRYRPFAETGEFANIGIIALEVRTGLIEFQLAPKRFARVRHFFDAHAHDAYGGTIDALRVELPRIAEFLVLSRGHSSVALFDDITRERESSVIYSDVRVLKSKDTLGGVVGKLFSRYVKRDFITLETAETTLTKGIRRVLRRNGITSFRQIRINDEVVPISFPLASNENGFHAIKPLAFSQQNPLAVFDYGSHWHQRLAYLLDKGKLKPSGVLLAVEPPPIEDDDNMRKAFNLAREELSRLPFEVFETTEASETKILSFARQATLREDRWFG